MFRYVMLAALIALTPCAANAGLFEDGLAAAKRGDHKGAFELWHPLAEKGNASAQFNIGVMYENGRGNPRSYAKAVKWYQRAANQGFARAQVSLGIMFDFGRGVARDHVKAVDWYHKAAAQGSASGQSSLGGSYGNGRGVTKDDVQAHMWLSLAAAQGSKSAAKNQALIAKRMTPAEIEQAQKLAQDWKVEPSQ